MSLDNPYAPEPMEFFPLSALLSEPQAPQWLIRGYLEKNTLAVLYGPSGVMKTFVALDMAFSISAGLPWHGVPTANPGPCFYVAGEGYRGLGKRLKALTLVHKVNVENVHFFTSRQAAHLLSAASESELTEALRVWSEQFGKPSLVVFDTLNRCFGPGDENRTADMTQFITVLDRIRSEFGCAVLVIHHSGVRGKDRGRGSSALPASVDTELQLTKAGNIRTLSCTKMKDHEEPPSFAFEPETVKLGWFDPETGLELESCVLRRLTVEASKARRRNSSTEIAYRALIAACDGAESASEAQWRQSAYEMGISPKRTKGGSQAAFRRAKNELLEAGRIEEDARRGWYLTVGQVCEGEVE